MRNKRSARLAVASIEHADRWFESNCHHHLEALVDQGLPPFLPFGITAEGFTFFKVHLGDVNSSGHHSVHTVVWLSCRKIGVALLVESGKKASPKRCSGDALNLNNFRITSGLSVHLSFCSKAKNVFVSTELTGSVHGRSASYILPK